jgi:menaquinone-dependent protoporphyrinogen IX oxidase
MKTLVCYKTKAGSTEKYAKWITEATGADLKRFDEIPRRDTFEGYDCVVVSSGTYAGFMPLNRFLKRHWKNLEGKKVVVIAVGAAPADDPWSIRSYNRIPEKIRNNIQYFKLMGEDPGYDKKENYVPKVKKENLKPVLAVLK